MAQPTHTLRVERRNQTRALKRKSIEVSAPTGHTYSVIRVYGWSSWRPGATTISFRLPRSRTLSTGSLASSSETRTQRVHTMQRSASYTMVGPNTTALGLCTGSSRMRFLVPECSSQ